MFGSPVTFITIIAIAGGLFLIIHGLLTYKKDKTQLYLKRCSEQTNATVDGFDDRKSITRKERDHYYYEKYSRVKTQMITYTTPIFRFKATDGKEYRVTYIRPVEKKLNLDQKVKISYNPQNPYEVFLHGDKAMKVGAKSSIEMGGILLIVAIALLIIV